MKKKQRDNLPDSAFVYPKTRQYPIHDRAHAKAALSMAARKDTAGDFATVRAAVVAKHGKSMVGDDKKKKGKK